MPENLSLAWQEFLKPELDETFYSGTEAFLAGERARYRIFPPEGLVYRAFSFFPPQKTKVVILGQDPYHEAGEAEGLCFSVPEDVKIPPSLRNIRKEIFLEFGEIPKRVSLTPWAEEGVLLLNAVLSVREGLANSHAGLIWEKFTSAVLNKLSRECDGLVFLLWGNFAKKAALGIRSETHLILTCSHPSPLSQKGFFGCEHFKKANEFLLARGKSPINWLS